MKVDNDPLHLFPAFRERILKVLEETGEKTGHRWVIVEGYRSQARQTELYAIGRTTHLDQQPVTWMKSPKWHGTGLAADVAPISANTGAVTYKCPRLFWEMLRKVGQKHGLINPAWSKGDLGHLQHGDTTALIKAQTFIAKGFQV